MDTYQQLLVILAPPAFSAILYFSNKLLTDIKEKNDHINLKINKLGDNVSSLHDLTQQLKFNTESLVKKTDDIISKLDKQIEFNQETKAELAVLQQLKDDNNNVKIAYGKIIKILNGITTKN